MIQRELFASQSAAPDGFVYAPDFLSAVQEAKLLAQIQALPFQEAQYKEWRARRRIVAFGGRYDYARHELTAAPPIPEFLYPLRGQIAQWAGIPVSCIEHAMVAEYQPATPLGWHRDVPEFEDVVGVSVLGRAKLRFRRWPAKPHQRTTFAIELSPRSAYLLRGAVRWKWQHAVSPTKELRYSITLRTRRN